MLRITTGIYKNKTLEVANSISRPFTERMRISVFDLLQDYIADSIVLDLYAGSGAVGIEALSRGAKSATFVDSNRKAYFLIKENLRNMKIGREAEAYNMSVSDFLRQSKTRFDLIFLDPPFAKSDRRNSQIDISDLVNITHQNSLIILRVEKEIYRSKGDHSSSDKNKTIKHDGLKEGYTKKFGRSFIIFYSPEI